MNKTIIVVSFVNRINIEMKEIFTRSFLSVFILSLFCITTDSKATHVAGSELVYEWQRDSTYRIYFKFFEDCGGNYAALEAFDLCYYNPCNGYSASMKIRKMSLLPGNIPNGTPVSTGCPGVATSCDNIVALIPGYREWWYMAELTLPSRCDSWIFSVSVNARNPSSNLVNADRYNLYIEATLNNQDPAGFAGGNHADFSSPQFVLKPVPYICINVPMSYSGGPVDPNGDQLTYEFITPRHIGGGGATPPSTGANCQPGSQPGQHVFTTPYNLANPFATNNTFYFDTLTGVMTFTPALLGANTVSIRVNKFRNGVKLGSVMRDVQFQVINCTMPPIEVDMIATTVSGSKYNNGRIEACLNVPARFCYKVVSNQSNSILVVEDNHAAVLPGSSATYVNQYTDSVLACISFTPTDTGVTILNIVAKDSSCRAPGVMVPQTFAIPIYVRPAIASYQELDICLGDTLLLNSNGSVNVRWSVLPGGDDLGSVACPQCSVTVARPKTTTTYVAKYTLINTCGTGDTVVANVTENYIDLLPEGPVVLCRPDSLHLEAVAGGPKPWETVECGFVQGGQTAVTDTTDIRVLTGNLQGNNNPESAPFNTGYTTARHQYLVRASDMLRSGMRPGRLTSLAFYVTTSTATVTVSNFSVSLKCTDEPLSRAGIFQTGAVPVYTPSGPLTIPAATGWIYLPFDGYYSWDGKSDLLVDICYANTGGTATPVYTTYYPTDYDATLYSYNFGGNICNGGPGLSPTALLSGQLPQMRFGWEGAPEKPFSYTWSGSVFSFNAPDSSSAVTWIDASSKIVVHTEGRNGCMPSDTLDVIIPVHEYDVHPDTVICEGQSVTLYIKDRLEGALPFTARWYEQAWESPSTLSCDQCYEPVARPVTDRLYTVVATDEAGCADTLQVQVQVDPAIQVSILNNDTLIGYGERLQLQARGAAQYTWEPDMYLDNPRTANPFATPKGSVTYTVTGQSGVCIATDSIHIRVDQRGKLFIPSAFTPNGDGMNDVFRIGNFTFQKLEVFRVFNRFGEVVFQTLDGKDGWDGTWKGIPQDMGVYFYHIRVKYPDETTDTFKGDVTLVR